MHLSLEQLSKLVEENIGSSHNFEIIYCPINLGMPESFAEKYQSLGTCNIIR